MDKGVDRNILLGRNQNVQTFEVTAEQDGNNLDLGLKGKYKLKIGNGSFIVQGMKSKECIEWSLKELRHFCHTSNTFSVVSGTRSSTGVGKFTFLTNEPATILSAALAEISRMSKDIPGMNDYHAAPGTSSKTNRRREEKEKKDEKEKKEEKTNRKEEEIEAKKTISNSNRPTRGPHYEDADGRDSKGKGNYSETDPLYAQTTDFSYPGNSTEAGQRFSPLHGRFPFVPQQGLESPFKKATPGRDVLHTTDYFPATRREVSPLRPPPWISEAENSNSDSYEHITLGKNKVAESKNIYGMASASAPLRAAQADTPNNMYQDTGVYEPVGKGKR